MRRRAFIALIGAAAAAWPLVANGQSPARMPRIGIIDDAPIWDSFRQGLRDRGYIEGQNIALVYRSGEGNPERLKSAAVELARLPVDLIATFGTPASLAAKAATTTIPIVAISVGDPVGVGLVQSLARPGGNITGNTILGPDIVAKRLQILKELIPSVSRLAFLWNPDNGSNAAQLPELRAAVASLGMALVSVEVRAATDFDAPLADMMRQRVDAFQMTNDPFHQTRAARIIDFVNQNRLPAMYQTRANVVVGGLLSYGPNLADLFRRAAVYVDKLLQGTKPANLPIEQPIKFELAVNLKTAKAIGLAIPKSFLTRADEVIE